MSENIELKKRLEDLELNNKTLLSQLQKMQNTLNQSNTNQFGTILMVVVLFFAVVLGVWSPLLTKDQLSSSSSSSSSTTSSSSSSSSTATRAASTSASSNSKTASENTLKSVVEGEEIIPFKSYASKNLKSRVLVAVDDELVSFDVAALGENVGGDGGWGGGGGIISCNNNNNINNNIRRITSVIIL